MPKFKVTTADGQEGIFDPVVNIVAREPSLAKARITGWDAKSQTIKAVSEQGDDIELNVPQYAASLGIKVKGLEGEFNDSKTAVDSSPVSLWQRFKLGLANSESGEVKTLLDAMKGVAAPEMDANSEKHQARALAMLRKQFDDAKYVNGEYVVKKEGVWHKADAPGFDAGDALQFAAGNGLNIIASIAAGTLGAVGGSVVPGAGTAAGGIAAAGVGAGLAEAAEEALAYAIVGEGLDVEGALQDITTESIMGLGGEGAAKGVMKVGSAAVKATRIEAVENGVKQTIQGFKNFATKADPKVKDAVAGVYGQIGPGMSRATTREMIESPETVQQALMTGKVFNSGDAGRVKVHTAMVDTLQTAIEGVEHANQELYGAMVDDLALAASKSDAPVTLNLNETLEGLEKLLKNASPEKRNFLDPVIGKTKELIEAMRPAKAKSVLLDASGKVIEQAEKPAILEGAAAIRALHKLKMSTSEKLGKLGAFTKNTVDSLTDADTLRTAMDMEDFLDSKILAAADTLDLTDSVKAARSLYGETKDALRPIKGKIFSEKMPINNIIKAAREEAGEDVITAFARLDKLPSGKAVTKALRQVRIAQAGIETAPRFAVPKETVKQSVAGAGAVATVAANPVLGSIVVGSMMSPRAAAFVARNLTSSGGAAKVAGKAAAVTGKAVSMGAEGARKAASVLTSRAVVSGFIHTLSREQKDELMRNPEAFQELLSRSGNMEKRGAAVTKEKVMEAAIKASNEKGK